MRIMRIIIFCFCTDVLRFKGDTQCINSSAYTILYLLVFGVERKQEKVLEEDCFLYKIHWSYYHGLCADIRFLCGPLLVAILMGCSVK